MNLRPHSQRPTLTMPRVFTRRLIVRRVLAVAFLGLVAGLALDEVASMTSRNATFGTSPTPSPAALRGAAIDPGHSGMVAAIDPETGELTEPTPEQMRALRPSAAAPHKSGRIEITELPDGTILGKLDESFLHYSIAHIDADGTLHSDCTRDAIGNALPLPRPAPPSPVAPEK